VAELLHNPIQPYAWGSRTVLAQVQGRPWPTAGPEAELWIGAHSVAPSTVLRGQAHRSLDEVIAADLAGELGAQHLARFGPRLPFLAKFLAVERPLSIQVHPDNSQAEQGYAAEQAERGDADSPKSRADRNYPDQFGKPEILVTRTPFELLSGVRPVAEAAQALLRLGVEPELDAVACKLTGQASVGYALWELLHQDDPMDLVERAAVACERLAADSTADSPHAGHDRLLPRLAQLYPGDPGVLVALLLNVARLPAGVAVFTPPGVPHAYVSGTGFEVMASSDNVLRGGLTTKHVDVDELLRLVSVASAPITAVEPTQLATGMREWRVPVAEFTLVGVDVHTGAYTPGGSRSALRALIAQLPAGWEVRRPRARTPLVPPLTGPRLVVCDAGTVSCTDKHGSVTVRQGEAAYCAASAGPVEIAGVGSAFVVGVG